jgi:hypothetical protein
MGAWHAGYFGADPKNATTALIILQSQKEIGQDEYVANRIQRGPAAPRWISLRTRTLVLSRALRVHTICRCLQGKHASAPIHCTSEICYRTSFYAFPATAMNNDGAVAEQPPSRDPDTLGLQVAGGTDSVGRPGIPPLRYW